MGVSYLHSETLLILYLRRHIPNTWLIYAFLMTCLALTWGEHNVFQTLTLTSTLEKVQYRCADSLFDKASQSKDVLSIHKLHKA